MQLKGPPRGTPNEPKCGTILSASQSRRQTQLEHKRKTLAGLVRRVCYSLSRTPMQEAPMILVIRHDPVMRPVVEDMYANHSMLCACAVVPNNIMQFAHILR